MPAKDDSDSTDIDGPQKVPKEATKAKKATTKAKTSSKTSKTNIKEKSKPKAKSAKKSQPKGQKKATTKAKSEKKSQPKGEKKTNTKSKSKPKVAKTKKATLKVSNQIPKERRATIEKSLSKAKRRKRRDWDRAEGAKQHRIANKRVKPNSIRRISMPLLDVNLGESWDTPITVIHGARPGPVVTITGAIHGDELVGPLACSMLCQESMTGSGRALDPSAMAGTIRIVPVLNPPGYRRHNRYFPDGRDLNRQFPGTVEGNTTSRVADKIWENLIISTDYLLDLHSAARGRTNLPQVRANLAHPESNRVARAFGVEVVLDSKGPRGTLRRNATEEGIGAITYEGGGATLTDHEAVKVAVYGVLNVLRSLKVIPGYPNRPRFRLLASGSTWIRSEEGGLVDMFVQSGSFVEKGDIIGRIVDPHKPGMSADILSPERGLLICSATNPFVTAGTPVGHLLPISRGVKLVKSQLDEKNRLIVSGSVAEPPWREEYEVDEISILGQWQGGDVDSEWQRDWPQESERLSPAAAEEEDSEEEF
ncbi:MAG: hypothetical protein CXX81_15305 [Methanobacteriota archaeon]|nr:MAG: hypothetical protein CXX81_15305 [Euryarchaeota archaeon]HIO86680.1 succinylglutamate desuccinylase/aspartoacylase family protein [Candidatus Poseidoniales archaeon]